MILALFALTAALLAACFPVQLAVTAVFLFAGPHNWMEARYFAARMPVRWAGQRKFFVLAAGGVAVLGATFTSIPVSRPVWHCVAALWVLALLREARRGAWEIALPGALLWTAFAWALPYYADLVLVFLHPLAALWFVRRQIMRTRPEWVRMFRSVALGIVPMAAAVVVARAAGNRGSALLALHAFLEMLHYGAWVALLPAIGLAAAPWKLESIPLVRHRLGWPRLMRGVFAFGALGVIALWIGFAVDYRTTYELYFTVAILHVLAELPLMVWLR